jgi:type II secretory pathway component PulC
LHPEKRLQRQTGLRDGDILTAINGVEITDQDSEDALNNALNSSDGAVSLTYSRNGVQQTVKAAVNN